MTFSINNIMPARGWSALGGKKYWFVFKNSLQKNLVYRFNVYTAFLGELIGLAVMAYLWMSIYRQGGKVGAYTLGILIVYYVIARFIRLVVRVYNIAEIISDRISSGGITLFLTKPISFFGENLSTNLASSAFRIIFFGPIFALICFFWLKFSISWTVFVYFSINLLMAVLITFMIFYIVAMSAFFADVTFGYAHVVQSLVLLFSGGLVPLDMLPHKIKFLSDFLPFKFMIYIPVKTITEQYDFNMFAGRFFQAAIWAVVLYIFTFLAYKMGLKKYEAYGG